MNKILTLLLAITFTNCFAESALHLKHSPAGKGGYKISGNIKELSNVDVYLGNYYGDKQYLKDTAHTDASGNFVFEGKETLPGGIYLVVTPRKTYFELIIDKVQTFSFATDTADFIADMKIKGSEDNILFYEYLKNGIVVQQKIDSLQKELKNAKTKADTTALYDQMKSANKSINDYRDKFIKDHPAVFLSKLFKAIPEPEVPERPAGADSTWGYFYYRAHYLDNVDFGDNRMLRTPVFHQKLEKFLTQIVPQIPDTINYEADKLVDRARPDSEMFKYVVWWITYHYETSKIMGLDEVFAHMVEKYVMTGQCWWYDSTQTKKLIQKYHETVKNCIGCPAPPLNMLDMYMNPLDIKELKNDWIVVVFWDPTCGHCKKEIPKLDTLYRELLRPHGVEVWGVNMDGIQKEWMDYVEEHHLEWINVWDPYNQSKFRETYGIKTTPVIYVIDKNRKIAYKRIDVDTLREIFEKQFKEKK